MEKVKSQEKDKDKAGQRDEIEQSEKNGIERVGIQAEGSCNADTGLVEKKLAIVEAIIQEFPDLNGTHIAACLDYDRDLSEYEVAV